ncbi:MAG: lysophospholipid acyltransferase family protein [Planctomycetota bacterium]
MRDRVSVDGPMPAFWPPRPSRFWSWLLAPLNRRQLRGKFAVSSVEVEGMERLRSLPPGDGALITPNHSYAGDGVVMVEAGRSAPRPFHLMAAWQLFTGHGGLDGWLMQRQGCFSVDREGSDRRAMRTATGILAGGGFLVVFPEGENYHLNDRLTPLREGVAFMAATAQKEKGDAGRVWLVPTAIRYRFAENVAPRLEAALESLEAISPSGTSRSAALPARILAFGEALLSVKEKEILGSQFRAEPLPARLERLMRHLIERHEAVRSEDPAPVRVKRARAKLLALPEEERTEGTKRALADLHLAIQLFSYPGDYLSAAPTPERMAETLEKFEEDLTGEEAKPVARRLAQVVIGEPIDVKAALGDKRAREAAEGLTVALEGAMTRLISARPALPQAGATPGSR